MKTPDLQTCWDRLRALQEAERHLRDVRDLVIAAGAPLTAAACRRALKSLAGAIRHARARHRQAQRDAGHPTDGRRDDALVGYYRTAGRGDT